MIIERKDNTALITFDTSDMEVVDWIEQIYGLNEFNKLLNNFITQRRAQMDDTQKNELWTQIKASGRLSEVKDLVQVNAITEIITR